MPPEIGKKPEKKPFNIYKKKPQGSFFKKSSQNFIKPIDKPVRKNFSRKFAEQQATKRFIHPEKKESFKPRAKTQDKSRNTDSKRELKLTISRAMNVEEFEIKQRSLASVKRARQKEKKLKKDDVKKEFKKVIRDVNIPDKITIQELSNMMAEQSSSIIKFLLNMGVQATINHTIDKDTAEYIVKEFGHKPILEDQPTLEKNKVKEKLEGDIQTRAPVVTIMGHVDLSLIHI